MKLTNYENFKKKILYLLNYLEKFYFKFNFKIQNVKKN